MGDIGMINNYTNRNDRRYRDNRKYNPRRKVNYSRKTGMILQDNVNYNEYDGIKNIHLGNGGMIDGFRVKHNHVAMFDEKNFLIKVATSIVTKPDKKFVIVFVRGRYEWLKNNYSLEQFEEDFGSEYLHVLDGAKDIYADSGEAKEIYDELMIQTDYVASHLFEIYSGKTEELLYLLDIVNKYNQKVCRRININADILNWDNTKTFNLEDGTITGGLPLYEDVSIELEYLKNLGISNYLSFRKKIDNLAYNKFIQTMLPFISYIKAGKWK